MGILGGEERGDQLAKAGVMMSVGLVVTGILLWIGYLIMKKDDREEEKKRQKAEGKADELATRIAKTEELVRRLEAAAEKASPPPASTSAAPPPP
jgi:hypothetical protein